MTEQAASPNEDIIRKGIKRELPVKLTEPEELAIARYKAKLERELEETQANFSDVKREWNKRIEDLEKQIALKGAALRLGEEKRVVPCYERWRSGLVETVREDMPGDDPNAVIDRRAANLAESQKVMPGVDAAQADAAKTQADAGVAEDDEGDVVPIEGNGKKGRRK